MSKQVGRKKLKMINKHALLSGTGEYQRPLEAVSLLYVFSNASIDKINFPHRVFA